MLFLFVLLVGLGIWFVIGVPGGGFLHAFANLLDRPEIVAGFINWLSRRSYLKGEFRGRKVVILLQLMRGKYGRAYLVVSMETGAATTMDSHHFAGYRPDRETELALFALEVKHELRLTHQDSCLKALWEPFFGIFFPGRFEQPKWQSVLEAMHTVAGSVERRAA